jgi:hypothetical protein
MSTPTGELVVPASNHPSGLWVGIYVGVGTEATIFMVLDTGSPVSALSPAIAQHLHTVGLLHPAEAAGYFRPAQFTAWRATGRPALPDLPLRILPRLGRLQIDGLLGLDFFRQFERVCFQLSQMRLELSYATR